MRVSRGTTPRRAPVGAGGLRGGSVTPHVPDPPRRRAGVALAIVVGLAVGLTVGCTPDPGPTPSTSPSAVISPSPTVTPTPTPTPTPDASVKPERPAAMDEVSAAGAEAVAVYFLQLLPYAFATGDLADYGELSHPDCIFCASAIAQVDEQATAGNHSVGGLIEVTSVISAEIDTGRWWSTSIEIIQEPSQTLDSSGQLVEDFPETIPYRMDLAVVYESGHWSIREVSHERTDQ